MRALHRPEVKEKLLQIGVETMGSTPAQLGEFIARELAKFQSLARGMGSFKVD